MVVRCVRSAGPPVRGPEMRARLYLGVDLEGLDEDRHVDRRDVQAQGGLGIRRVHQQKHFHALRPRSKRPRVGTAGWCEAPWRDRPRPRPYQLGVAVGVEGPHVDDLRRAGPERQVVQKDGALEAPGPQAQRKVSQVSGRAIAGGVAGVQLCPTTRSPESVRRPP